MIGQVQGLGVTTTEYPEPNGYESFNPQYNKDDVPTKIQRERERCPQQHLLD